MTTTIYRGKQEFVHIEDGQRAAMGRNLASSLDLQIRSAASRQAVTLEQLTAIVDNPLCPGCYMVAVFNCAVALAQRNGQSLSELGNSLANAFRQLSADTSIQSIESIEVMLDSDPCPIQDYNEARLRSE